MYRSVRFFSLASPWPDSEQALADALDVSAFAPCGPLTERTSGWEPPVGEADAPLARRVAGADLLRLRTQMRVLPAPAVDEALEARLEEYRTRMQQEPTRRTRRQLKEKTRDELLPKALLKSERTRGACILSERIVAIDAGAEARAERFVEHLRGPLPKLALKPLEFEQPVAGLMTRILLGDAPAGFTVGRECRMHDPADVKSTVRWTGTDLDSGIVRRCLKEGMQLTHLGIEFGAALSCVIDGNFAITKLRLVGMDEREDVPLDDDPFARFDAEAALLTGTLRELVVSVSRLLGRAG